MALAVPALAAKLTSVPITHGPILVYQAYPIDSNGNCVQYCGYRSANTSSVGAIQGVLDIEPGNLAWCNFVNAAQSNTSYVIKNTTLVKQVPDFVQCNGVFGTRPITQQGSDNIRKNWALLYEPPGTTFLLSILYGTPQQYDDDGSGPNPAAWAHVEQWIWQVDANLDSLGDLLRVFHSLPFGTSEVPLISDEDLYEALLIKLEYAQKAYSESDTASAALILADFELEVMDACICVAPYYPNVRGIGTGIANTAENPACCTLLTNVEYILNTTGIGKPSK